MGQLPQGAANETGADVRLTHCARLEASGEACEDLGVWSPILKVSPDGETYATGSFFKLPVCDEHKETLQVDDLIGEPQASGESGWETICRVFRGIGLQEPKREFCKIEWQEF